MFIPFMFTLCLSPPPPPPPNWSRQMTTHLEPKGLSEVSAF